MKTLYDWKAQRAGAAITITHSTGKITGIAVIAPARVERGAGQYQGLVAIGKDGQRYELEV